jgi:hypothetical protein
LKESTNQIHRYCGCDVRYIRKHPDGGYLVSFRDNASKLLSGTFNEKLRWVHAKKFIFLGAGSIGSTEIILRSREQGLQTSTRVGKDLSGNGSFLSFGYDLDSRLGDLNPKERPGPTISAMIDIRDTKQWEQSFIIQDGTWPRLMDIIFRITKPILPITSPKHGSIQDSLRRILEIVNPFTDALRRSQVYLALGHDTPCGSLTLQDDLPLLDMRGVERKSTISSIKKLLIKMTHAFGGTYIEQGCKVTVHPLGGLGYAGDGTGRTGSVNHMGELFMSNGIEVHAGLCAVDGSIISRSLAANPLATITAAAERSMELLAEKYGLRIDLSHSESYLKRSRPNTVTFAEKMQGAVDFGGKCAQLVLYVDVEVSTDKTTGQDKVTGRLSGTVHCSHLSDDQLMITDGTFRLFEPDQARADRSTMEYRFTAVTTNGERFSMMGMKFLDPSVTLSCSKLWQATTTLSLHINDTEGHIVGSGLLRLGLPDFVDQMRTMTTSGEDIYGRRTFLIDFFKVFAKGILERFLSALAPLQHPEDCRMVEEVPEYRQKSPPKAKIQLRARDGVSSILRMWEPAEPHIDSKEVVHDILFVPGSAVSHWIFASPYIGKNAIEYFTRKGYRCWCVTTRFGKQHENRTDTAHAWTGYDARLDIAAALTEIKRWNTQHSAGYSPPYVIAHCVGSLALASALLDGTVHKSAISGITASQIFLNPVLQPLNELKARIPLTRLYRILAGDWFPISQTREQATRNVIQDLLDNLLRFYPLNSKIEICSSTACHRCNLAFGRLWNHRNLNKATHDNLQHVFGGTSSTCLEHLASGGRRQTVLDNNYRSLVTDGNLERLRGIPIFLFSGADNNVFKATSTLKTHQVLKARGETVCRREFEGFGHLDCWMSEKSADVVYPPIEEEMRKALFSPNRNRSDTGQRQIV